MCIHEKENWTGFYWEHEAILSKLASVRHLQGKLLGRMERLGFDLSERATLESLILEVVDTSKIEGEFLNPELVRSSIARKLGLDGAEFVTTPRNIDGIVDVLLDATQNYDKPLLEERLLGWHNSLFQSGYSGYQKIDVARYRSAGMKVISGAFGREKIHFEAPSAERVPQEMDSFLDWLNNDNSLDLVLKSAISHLWFVTIHPFDDGNGRLARAIMDMLLARSESTKIRFYSMSNQIYKEHKRYNEVIEKTQKGTGDITAYLDWFLSCFEQALHSSEKNLEIILDKSRFWDKHKFTSISDRQRQIINYLYDNYDKEIGFLRTSVYAKLTKCSNDTALRDLQNLVAKEMLATEDSGKKTNYLIVSPANIRIPKITASSIIKSKKMTLEKITIQATLSADKQKAWDYYTQPEHITQWNFADPSWHCPSATNDMTIGGRYVARMEARDGSFGFDFDAVYTDISVGERFTYEFGGRYATVEFKGTGGQTEVTVAFDPETENPIELQRNGWQAILNNYKKYTESN